MQHPHHPDTQYSLRVRALEADGNTTSDAQAIADIEDLDDVAPVATTDPVSLTPAVDPGHQRDQLKAAVTEALRLIAIGRIGEAQVVLHTAQERIDEQVATEAQQ